MMDEKYMPLALEYIEGGLSPEGEKELQACLAAGHIREAELQELAALYGKLPDKKITVPTNRMQHRFYKALAGEQEAVERKKHASFNLKEGILSWWQRFSFGQWGPQLAFGMILLLVGTGMGYLLRSGLEGPGLEGPGLAGTDRNAENQLAQLSKEVQQMRELMMLNMLEQSSSTDRLKAVNISYELPQADTRIVEALLNTLNNDPNVNVRLAAVEALRQHAGQPAVRQGLIESINDQESPMVQIALADLMVELQEKKAVEPIRRLLEKGTADESVRQKLQESIHVLI